MKQENDKLDFIVIGAARAASTWFYQCLKEHPEICFSQKKETYLFDQNRYVLEKSDYFNKYFSHCCGGQVKGTASLSYLTDSQTSFLLKKEFSSLKIIACLRNPIERAYSHYWLYKTVGKIGKDVSFKEALANDPRYLSMGFYCEGLKKYYQAFGQENVLTLIYEDIKKDPSAVIKKVYRFLGVDDSFNPFYLEKIVHPSTEKRLKWNFLSEHNINQLKKIKPPENTFCGRLAARLIKLLRLRSLVNFIKKNNLIDTEGISSCPFAKPSLDKEIRSYLQDIYQDEIKKIERLLRRDLSFWH